MSCRRLPETSVSQRYVRTAKTSSAAVRTCRDSCRFLELQEARLPTFVAVRRANAAISIRCFRPTFGHLAWAEWGWQECSRPAAQGDQRVVNALERPYFTLEGSLNRSFFCRCRTLPFRHIPWEKVRTCLSAKGKPRSELLVNCACRQVKGNRRLAFVRIAWNCCCRCSVRGFRACGS